ncbi:MAG: outer membrane protein assembly factor BamA [Alphaproteobacteria bacterium]|nr:outer membrane protein assembly factor BamA [Alphaproteobacteria bacterium]
MNITKYTLLTAISLVAFQVQAETLKAMKIQGTRRIEDATITNYTGMKIGQNVTPHDLDRATKTLFASGLFSDVNIKMNNGIATVKVEENPIVHEVFFEGNKALEDDVLKTEVQMKPRSVYTKTKVQKDADRLLAVYKRNGRFAATIEPKIIEKDQNRVDVIFEINEGGKAFVEDIKFVGNNAFSESTLEGKMMTQEKAWYRFLSSTDTYDADRFKYDQELLRRFYLEHGYLDFKITDATAELTPDKEGFILTIKMDEGEPFRIEKQDLQVSLPDYKDTLKLEKYLEQDDGDILDITKVETTVDELTERLLNDGYAFVNVEPDIIPNHEKHTATVVYRISEGEKIFIRRINIKGNTRTQDKVIRREFRIKEGDAFNASLLRRSKQNVSDLDYFSNVEMDTAPVPMNPSLADVNMSVTEKSTGAFNIGIGWSSYDGMMFETGIQERNILGTGKAAGLDIMLSQRETQYTISLTDPYFLGYNMSAGIDLYHTTRDNSDSSSYSYKTTGGTIRFGWDYTDALRQVVRYTLRQDDIYDIDSDAALSIKEQKGKTIVSMIGQDLIYDKRDSRLNPTKGYYTSLSTDLAGLGGDTKFFRVDATAIKYFPVAEDVVFSLRADGGYIWGIGGKDLRINDRYFLGDRSLRGFEYGGVGARDKASDDALGGDWYSTVSAELTFPIGLPKEMGIKGKLFTDAGLIGKPDDFDSETMEYSNRLRAAVGTGIEWSSPMGVINFDFSYAFAKEKYDKTRVFRLNFGKGF